MEHKAKQQAQLQVQNVGGIDETSVEFTDGVTILEGRNATNRTSLLRAVMAVCGSDDVSIKANADKAKVTLELGEETHTWTATQSKSGLQISGDPYLDDATVPDLFSFLLESNEARLAVARGDDLRELIMRPVDTDEIQAEIERLLSQRRELDNQLDKVEERKSELPGLEAKRTQLRDEIEDKREKLAKKEDEIESLDASVEETRETNSELETRLKQLRDLRSSLEETRYTLETERERLDVLESERTELKNEYETIEETPMGNVEELESELGSLREEKQAIEAEINELQSVITFNEEMLENADNDVLTAIGEEGNEDSVTDDLLQESKVTCWTCGEKIAREQVQSTLDQLRELTSSQFEKVSSLNERIDELKEERRELRESQNRRDEIERRLNQLDTQIENLQESIAELEERRDTLRDEVEEIEVIVENLEGESRSDLLDRHKEANQLEHELGRLESDLEDVEAAIDDAEAEIAREESIKSERLELQSEIESLRTKIESIEKNTVDEFNEHMNTLLTLLNYDNLDRIWLERTEKEVREGRQKNTKRAFELHVVRSTASGTTYEDTIHNLSESEREVTGLVFAFAGNLVHEVHDDVPFMLLDSLEAIDSDRIATLVDYFKEYSRHLIVALLPEDASALDSDYQSITEV